MIQTDELVRQQFLSHVRPIENRTYALDFYGNLHYYNRLKSLETQMRVGSKLVCFVERKALGYTG